MAPDNEFPHQRMLRGLTKDQSRRTLMVIAAFFTIIFLGSRISTV